MIWTTLAVPVLVSERVLGTLRERHFSGWDSLPIELRGKEGERLPRYYFLCVSGRCGPIDYSLSKRLDKQYPGGVFPVAKGLYFAPATWDGSDVFMAPGTGFKFVVEEVKAALEQAGVRNVVFERLDDVELEEVS